VLGEGKIPAEVLFVGEAPGDSEDAIGRPFVGPAGDLLRSVVNRVIENDYNSVTPRIFWSNLVACIPKNTEGKKQEPPEAPAIEACRSRVIDLINILDPEIIIAVGKLPESSLISILQETERTPALFKIVHPASILRMDSPVFKGINVERMEVTIRDAFYTLERFYERV